MKIRESHINIDLETLFFQTLTICVQNKLLEIISAYLFISIDLKINVFIDIRKDLILLLCVTKFEIF